MSQVKVTTLIDILNYVDLTTVKDMQNKTSNEG